MNETITPSIDDIKPATEDEEYSIQQAEAVLREKVRKDEKREQEKEKAAETQLAQTVEDRTREYIEENVSPEKQEEASKVLELANKMNKIDPDMKVNPELIKDKLNP